MGKARVLNAEELDQVEKLSGVLNAKQLADFLGIDRATFFRIKDRQPEVEERYNRGRARIVGEIGRTLVQKALDGDNASMMFYLKTQAGWRETQGIDHTSSDGSVTPTKIELVTASVKNDDKAD